jgi:hypothetical protein
MMKSRKIHYVIILIVAIAIMIAAIGVYYYFGIQEKPTITQGIYGKVILITGDCMPGDSIENRCFRTPVSRAIYVRETVTMYDMEIQYLKNKSNLIKEADSNIKGFYEIELSVGTYSMFVEDEGREYCAGMYLAVDKACQIIIEDGLTEFNITIDHAYW